MKLIAKYLKPFALLVVISLVLLFGQALCDLSLPNLMSDIVTVGIQQNGIHDGAPLAMSEDGMKLIEFFMPKSDRESFKSGYTLVTAGSSQASEYEKDYPLIKQKNLFIRTENNTDKLTNLNTVYGKSALAMITFIKDFAPPSSSNQSMEGYGDIDITEIYSIIPMLSRMPEQNFEKAITASQNSDSMLHEQVGVTFTKLFYREVGVDLDLRQRNYLIITGLKMLGIAFLGIFAAILVGLFASRIAAKVAQKMRHDLFAKVESFSNAEFDQYSTASLITRTTNDIQQVQMLITMGLKMMCYSPIMGIGGIIFAVEKSVSLSWTIALAVAVLIGLILIILAIALPKFKSLQKLIDRLNLVSRENLSGMMVIRAFGNEDREEKRFDIANDELCSTTRFVNRIMAALMPVMMLLMNLTALLILWVGGHAIAESTLQIGDMMAFIQYTMQIIMSFLMIAMIFIMVPRAMVSAGRIREVLDTEMIIRDPQNPQVLENIDGIIEFNHVNFRYPKAEENVLEDITFTAEPGKTTAFIGATGSGKSTLINLIMRFYDVTDGTITIDGVDIRRLAQHDLHDMVGYVPQKGVLFSGTIETNIQFAKEDATEAQIAKALEVAQAKDFVDAKPEGIEAPIAQGGSNVSGGQKQRLAIARALVKQAPIYVFDDSFSALDFKTDAALRKALQQYTDHATVLIVAQRVSTIMKADQIIVLDNGKVVGKGTHSELLASCAEYREIAESQLSKEELQ